MTNPLKFGMRVEYVYANEPWQATVARVDGELFWLRDYSDGDDTESVYWHWSPHVFRILTPDYPKFATLDAIPIEPGRVEYRVDPIEYVYVNRYTRRIGNGPPDCTAGNPLSPDERATLRDWLDAFTDLIRALCNDPLAELREWGTSSVWKRVEQDYTASFDAPAFNVILTAPTRAEAVAKLCVAVRAVMG